MQKLKLLVALCIVLFASHATNADETLPLDISQYQGSVVVVDFWASWCGPCRESFPWLNEMQRKYADDDLVIVGVNVDSEKTDALRFLEAYPNQFEIVYDGDGTMAAKYEIIGMPSTLIFDRAGNLVSRHHGFKSKKKDEYEQAINDALMATLPDSPAIKSKP